MRIGIFAFLALAAAAATAAPRCVIAGDGYVLSSNLISRLSQMQFFLDQYALAYVRDPAGDITTQTLFLRAPTAVTFLNLSPNRQMAIMRVSASGEAVWVSPTSVMTASGSTLDKVLRGVDGAPTILPGGPYRISGNDVIGCRNFLVSDALNRPNARQSIGPDNFQALFIEHNCSDLPPGLEVEVHFADARNAIVTTVPDGYIFDIPRKLVVDPRGKPAAPFSPPQ